MTQVFFNKDIRVLKGMSIRLGGELSAVFDPQALCYRSIWQDGFVRFNPFRWGSSRNAEAVGEVWFSEKSKRGWDGDATGAYHGHYRYWRPQTKRSFLVLKYSIGDTVIEEMPSASDSFDGKLLCRFLTIPTGTEGITLRAGRVAAGTHYWVHQNDETGGAKVAETNDGTVWLQTGAVPEGSTLLLGCWRGPEKHLRKAKTLAEEILSTRNEVGDFTRGGGTQFPAKLKVRGKLGEPISASSPYVVDTLGIPFDNPYKTVMQLTSIGFFPDGSALVATLAGDVWKVTGIDDSLQNVSWKRYATGFNQPIGIHIDRDGVFVLDRGQITRLHDYNGDDEADFYENYANDFGSYDRSHSHTFGLHRTADGSFTFVQRNDVLRTGPDRKTKMIAWGMRNCMGIGGSDTFAWVAPQEGTWTPASMIIEVNEGEFYGLPKKGDRSPNIATPLCYVPRGIDNSTGGMIQVKSDRWGVLKDHHIGISYGSGSHYLILRDATGPRPQGATVPLEGDFLAGTMRGAFNPKDGQLYLVGLDGWGDYSTQDGCFHRVRHTGKPFRHPIGFEVHSNGIRVDFAEPVDTEGGKIFAHQWNYEYAKRYGSPEFSAKNPKSLGHDVVAIRKIYGLDGMRSIFVEIPDLEPVMQMHLRMHLVGTDGTAFKTDLFPSILHLGEHFDIAGVAPPVAGKPTTISLRVAGNNQEDGEPTESGEKIEGAREITVNAIGGLQFKEKVLRARPGEALSLILKNTDVMPHNLVIVRPGTIEEVGTKSFAMLNDPDAGKKHYIPDTDSVLEHTFVVPAGSQHTLNFKAPTTPGDYPYVCTFPGHWQAMRGILKVRP